jgi:nicotinate-nucleotide pyrophosphorylase (carboxylating)
MDIAALVRSALEEDRAFDDVTTLAIVPAEARSRGSILAGGVGAAGAVGVIAGTRFAVEAFRQLDGSCQIDLRCQDGTAVQPGEVVLTIAGSTRALLSAERVALNFLQRLSGVATLTRRYVDAVAGTGATILDTRKTLAGWREMEKYAVRMGGGQNHRMDLASMALIKDNHLVAAGGDVALAVARVRALLASGAEVEVEADTLAQVEAAVAAGAERILLDNMTLDQLREAVALVAGRARLEASGGVTLATVRAIAETGVDDISVGALTHSAPALDLRLDID